MNELFKYRDAKRGLEALKDHRLYLATPAQFEDDGDCSFQGFSHVDSDIVVSRVRDILQNNKYRQLAMQYGFFRGSPSSWKCKVKKILNRDDKFEPCLAEMIRKIIPEIIDYLSEFIPSRYEWTAKKFLKVLCLSHECSDRYLWENYGGMHTGIAIGLNRDKLEQLSGARIFKISYESQLPSYEFGKMTKEIAEQILSTKQKKFAPEKETRIVFQRQYGNWLDISDILSSIILGKNFSSMGEIKDICRRMYPNTPIYMITEDQNKNLLKKLPLIC